MFKIGDLVRDNAGFNGTVIEVTEWEGSRWYDVRFLGGVAVRYDEDLALERRR